MNNKECSTFTFMYLGWSQFQNRTSGISSLSKNRQTRCRLARLDKEGVNFINILRAAFSFKCFARNFFVLRFKVCTFLAPKYWHKSHAYNVGEIDTRSPPSSFNVETKERIIFNATFNDFKVNLKDLWLFPIEFLAM